MQHFSCIGQIMQQVLNSAEQHLYACISLMNCNWLANSCFSVIRQRLSVLLCVNTAPDKKLTKRIKALATECFYFTVFIIKQSSHSCSEMQSWVVTSYIYFVTFT